MMRATPGISVAISTMHRPDALARCLDAIWCGSVRPREIIVVDQSRDDATHAVVRDRCAAGMPILYQHTSAIGLGASQNQAVALSSAEVVAVTDDDCVVHPRWLEVIANAFATSPDLDLVAGRVLPLAAAGDRTWPVSSRTSTRRVEFHGYSAPWNVGSGNNFAVRRAAFRRSGGCDERLGPGSPAHGGVDIDLFFRMLRAGGRARYEPDAVVCHERQTLQGRRQRRPMYGYGTGACIAFRLRDGDAYAVRMLMDWTMLRCRLLARATLTGDRQAASEELVMLRATAQGLWHGFTV